MSEIIKGRTDPERFASMEVALRQMNQRISKKVAIVMPYTPHFYYCEKSQPGGEFYRLLAPGPMTLVSVAVHLGEMGTSRVSLVLTTYTDVAENATRLPLMELNDAKFMLNWHLDTKALVVFAITDAEVVRNISLSLLIKMDASAAETRHIAREALIEGVDN